LILKEFFFELGRVEIVFGYKIEKIVLIEE